MNTIKNRDKVCGIEVKYASWNEDEGGIFHSDCPHLSLIELARSKNIPIEEQYNMNENMMKSR